METSTKNQGMGIEKVGSAGTSFPSPPMPRPDNTPTLCRQKGKKELQNIYLSSQRIYRSSSARVLLSCVLINNHKSPAAEIRFGSAAKSFSGKNRPVNYLPLSND